MTTVINVKPQACRATHVPDDGSAFEWSTGAPSEAKANTASPRPTAPATTATSTAPPTAAQLNRVPLRRLHRQRQPMEQRNPTAKYATRPDRAAPRTAHPTAGAGRMPATRNRRVITPIVIPARTAA